MSNQLQITGGAKVRNLEGVLTGTSGVVNALGINVPSGIPQLDSNGKILVSQLPNSVMEYKGTWNAATNTPTLVNGTGNQGDVYLCSTAGTVNFGAGAITFAVGDQVIYSGTIWQKAGGSTGTVTSVSVTETGDALTITGSPITTSGTINIGFAGTASQYVNGAGGLTTFPSLTGYVPYSGATQTLDMGAFDVNARGIKINGTGGLGHADFKHQSGTPTGSASSSTLYANTDGDLAWLNDHSHTITLAASANTADRTYTFPNASGTIALTSDISYPVTSVFGRTGAVTAQSGDYTTTQVTEGTNLYFTDARARGAISLTTSGATGAATYNSTTGVLNIPNYSAAGYVPYSGATSSLNLGVYSTTTFGVNIYGDPTAGTGGAVNIRKYSSAWSLGTGDNLSLFATTGNALAIQTGGKSAYLDFNSVSSTSPRTYTLPDATGTIALTSDIPSLANYVTLTGTQTITGVKTFSNEQLFSNGLTINGGYLTFADSGFSSTLDTTTLTASRAILLPNASGTLALTSQLTNGTVTSVGLSSATSGVTIGSSPVTTSGTITLAIATASASQQGLLSSTDWTTFNNKQNALTNPVTGTGTSSYHAKFTGTSTIGNSMLTDDGTTLQSIGATRSNLYLKAASNSYYSQLAFTNGTNGSFGGLSYNNSGQYMQFETNSSEWMRLTSDGKLGIGTTSPSQILHLYGTSIRPQIESTANGGYSTLRFVGKNSGGTSRTFEVGLNVSADDVWQITNGTTAFLNVNTSGNVGIGTTNPTRQLFVNSTAFFDNNGDGSTTNPSIAIGSTSVGLSYIGGGNLALLTGGTERMRITSGGTICMNLTSVPGAETLQIQSTLSGSSQYGILIQGQPNLYTNYAMRFLYPGVAVVGSITFGTSTTSYNITSDYRLKSDFKDFNALGIISKIKFYDFKWNHEDSRMIGVKAHELQEIVPYAVTGEKDGKEMQQVDYSKLVAIQGKAIQELQAQIEELKALINK